jgi:phosphomannomutase
MHGVGFQWVKKAFDVFNHREIDPVPCQRDPDPNFPTVKFPNPEEKGALNESIKYAGERDATLIIANDPDADRLAVAERLTAHASTEQKDWNVFSGNEIGVLLGHWQIMRWKEQHKDENNIVPAVLASIVSSRMLKCIAGREGVHYEDTLTGKSFSLI